MSLIIAAEDLEREIGDSEAWDEASEDTGSDPPPNHPMTHNTSRIKYGYR